MFFEVDFPFYGDLILGVVKRLVFFSSSTKASRVKVPNFIFWDKQMLTRENGDLLLSLRRLMLGSNWAFCAEIWGSLSVSLCDLMIMCVFEVGFFVL